MAGQIPISGKTCLVTGASSGLGKETALGLARAGAMVLLVARDRERGEAAAAEIRQRAPAGEVELFLADLASQSQVRELAAQVLERHQRLDVLINNAAAMNSVRRVTQDGLEATVALNHIAPFLLTHLLQEQLRRAAPSRVVNVTSHVHRWVKAIPWDGPPKRAGISECRCLQPQQADERPVHRRARETLGAHRRERQLPPSRMALEDRARSRVDRDVGRLRQANQALCRVGGARCPHPAVPRHLTGRRVGHRRLLRQVQADGTIRPGTRPGGSRAPLAAQCRAVRTWRRRRAGRSLGPISRSRAYCSSDRPRRQCRRPMTAREASVRSARASARPLRAGSRSVRLRHRRSSSSSEAGTPLVSGSRARFERKGGAVSAPSRAHANAGRRRWSALLLRLRSSERRGSRTPLSKHRGRAEVPCAQSPFAAFVWSSTTGSRLEAAPFPHWRDRCEQRGGRPGRGAIRWMCDVYEDHGPARDGGVPCIRGLRIPVATVVGMLADGMATAEILDAYPDLEPDDLREALRYAAEAVRERELPLTATG